MTDSNDKISDALNTEFHSEETKEIVKKEVKPKSEKDLGDDYSVVRGNLQSIIEKGNEAIDGILEVASEGESPRAYEVVAQLIKNVSDANKDLIELHKKMKDITKEETARNVKTTNNSIFVGSTKELQDLVKGKTKKLSGDIIDVEVTGD
jgi:hypothetical protein